MRFQHVRFHLKVCGFLGLMLFFLSGCNSEVAEICSGKYDHSVTDALAQLEPLLDSASSQRSIASLNKPSGEAGQSKAHEMNVDQREHWESWSESELKRLEAYLDWVNFHREESPAAEKARRRLTDAANRLVAFHGYSQAGRVERMVATLKDIESDRKEIKGAVCK